MMRLNKNAGLLMHVTSLPSPYGVGDMRAATEYLLPFLKETEQHFWQILPLHPVGYGESPYQGFSAFAGNESWISPDELLEEGLITPEQVKHKPDFQKDILEFNTVREWKSRLFEKAFQEFQRRPIPAEYKQFLDKNNNWLPDYCRFAVIKEMHQQKPWHEWPEPLRSRNGDSLQSIDIEMEKQLSYVAFLQYLFFGQWQKMHRQYKQSGIQIIGDLPIFVAHDSVDVWANQHLFKLNSKGFPTVVAGVPPDYFSKTGQRWGNPHYQWNSMAQTDFKWWRQRIQHLLECVDIIRIDHFRGFEASWEIDASEQTAVKGRWIKAPGEALFRSLEKHLGLLPLIAEDLGVITPEVEALKKQFGFPGMKILQFSFDRKLKKKERPANYEKNTFAYTGTHDNDTLAGWVTDRARMDHGIRRNLKHYHHIDVAGSIDEACRQLIILLLNTNAGAVIIPMQDYLCLGTEARMNYPGTIGKNNWRWRCDPAHFRDPSLIRWILKQVRDSQRG